MIIFWVLFFSPGSRAIQTNPESVPLQTFNPTANGQLTDQARAEAPAGDRFSVIDMQEIDSL